jgi:hypothetical protein
LAVLAEHPHLVLRQLLLFLQLVVPLALLQLTLMAALLIVLQRVAQEVRVHLVL